MTAAHVQRITLPEPWPGPDPVRQERGDHTIEDVLNLPDDAPRVELLNGVMIVVPSPVADHQEIAAQLWAWLRQHCPETCRPIIMVGLRLDDQLTVEPDLVLLRTPFASRHYYAPDQVLLAVEVVSPGTRRRDRFEKPALYGAAGVPHYWRIEQEADGLHVYAYDLTEAGTYGLVADSTDVLKLAAPFDISLPIEAITP